MAGATAASAAGVSASYASLITVNLTNNFISATGGNHLNADLTGDGQSDLTIANAFYCWRTRTTYGHTLTGFTRVMPELISMASTQRRISVMIIGMDLRS